MEKTPPLTVGRGPVPRHAARNPTIAGETRSDARVASEGPRPTEKSKPEGTPTETHQNMKHPHSTNHILWFAFQKSDDVIHRAFVEQFNAFRCHVGAMRRENYLLA